MPNFAFEYHNNNNVFFRPLRKIAKSDSFVVFVRVEQLGSHGTDFHEILYLSVFRKSA